jgi:ornithine cyclodeaminase
VLHITDDMVAAAVGAADAEAVLTDAFARFGRGEAAMQERIRTEALGIKVSTLGGVIPGQEVAGAKVYTTIAGQFSFAIVLFSTTDGRLLATLEANAITRLRTAACSVIAARYLARPDSSRLAVFGAGVQGYAHAAQMATAFPIAEILLCSRRGDPALAAEMASEAGVPARLVAAEEALAAADIVVTASRSAGPLFSGERLRPGTFVAAVGSSLPTSSSPTRRCSRRRRSSSLPSSSPARRRAGRAPRRSRSTSRSASASRTSPSPASPTAASPGSDAGACSAVTRPAGSVRRCRRAGRQAAPRARRRRR